MPRARDYARELRERNTRARAQGFASYADKRATLATREGFTRSQGYGKPRRDELPITEYKRTERDLSGAAESFLVMEPHGKELAGRSLLITYDRTGERRIRVMRREQAEGLYATIERRNKLRRKAKGPEAGLPPVPRPLETP